METITLGLNLFRQLVSGHNALRDLDVFACNSGEHDEKCECFWEQCEQWDKVDALALSDETVNNYDALQARCVELEAALSGLFCCGCGRKFTEEDPWGGCTTHLRIRDLLKT